MKLQNLNASNFTIELYDLSGHKLADLTIDPTKLNSDFIDNNSQLMSYFQTMRNQTINGGQLPNTATHSWDVLAIGLLILLMGGSLFLWNFKKYSPS